MEFNNIGDHIIIEHHLFEISRHPLTLRLHGNPDNELIVDKDKLRDGDYCIGIKGNKEPKLIQFAATDQIPSVGLIIAWIPPVVLEEGFVNNFTIAEAINNESRDSSKNFLVPDKYIFQRSNGILSKLYIGSDEFEYDGEHGLLLPKDKNFAPISLEEFKEESIDLTPEDEDEYWYSFLAGMYDMTKGQLVAESNLTQTPGPIARITIPMPKEADPIGYARRVKVGDFAFLRKDSVKEWRASIRFDSDHSKLNIKMKKEVLEDPEEKETADKTRRRGLGL